ncbi:MAG: ABC transporter substrate-binding protein [Microthrixaceae bacterium]
MKAMGPEDAGTSSSAMRKWGPLAAIVVVLAVVAGVLVFGRDSGGGGRAADAPATTTAGRPTDTQLPEGVVSYSSAKEKGTASSIDWGARCDTSTGRLALPLSPPPECFQPFTGDNGGATETGVSADSITVVVYLNQPNDPILNFIYRQIGNTDTPDKIWQTYQGFNELFRTYYETYGRKVELVRYNATGNIQDPVAATSDAETIARDLKPYAVLGGPSLTEAFGDTLAANKVLCISCTPGQPNEWYEQRGPYVWDIAKNTDQNSIMVAEYVGKRLAGGKAQYGGDEVKNQARKLGLVYLAATPKAQELNQRFLKRLADYGVELTESASYTDPIALSGQARDVMARMKSKGVTTVLFAGDPLAPQTLTENATQQDYFPEWVITGTALVDTTLFGRTYDQAQWRHAFGPSNLFARTSPDVAGAGYLYRWYYGTPPPAQQAALVTPNLQLLYGVLQGAGPKLTHDMFRTVIFNSPIIASTVISPQISWGERGIWPGIDYAGLDDQTEVWWNATATGQDEIGNTGTGMWSYADGGKRYLPGQWPKGEPQLFGNAKNSVTLYTTLPPGITLPQYTPIKPAGG